MRRGWLPVFSTLSSPVSMTVISDIITPERRSIELSKVGAAWIVGSIIGPSLGAFVAEKGSFGLGMINYLLIGVTLFVTVFYVAESHAHFKDGKPGRDTIKKKPIISLGLLKKPLPRLLLIQSLISRIPYFMFVMTSSLYVTMRFGFTVAQIGTFFTGLSVLNFLIRSFLLSYVVRKLGDERTVRLGFVLYVVAFSWLAFAGSVWEFALINTIMSFATSTAVDVMSGVMSNAVKKDEMGEMMGLASAAESLAMVLGPIIGSSLLDARNESWYGLFGAALASIPLLLALRQRKKPSRPRVQEPN